MRRATFIALWALSVFCSLAIQWAVWQHLVDLWSAVIAVVASGVALGVMERLRRELISERIERVQLLAELKAIRQRLDQASEGAAIRLATDSRK